jgi:hypothetical protein
MDAEPVGVGSDAGRDVELVGEEGVHGIRASRGGSVRLHPSLDRLIPEAIEPLGLAPAVYSYIFDAAAPVDAVSML